MSNSMTSSQLLACTCTALAIVLALPATTSLSTTQVFTWSVVCARTTKRTRTTIFFVCFLFGFFFAFPYPSLDRQAGSNQLNSQSGMWGAQGNAVRLPLCASVSLSLFSLHLPRTRARFSQNYQWTPGYRFSHGMAYDADTNTVWLFGGVSAGGGACVCVCVCLFSVCACANHQMKNNRGRRQALRYEVSVGACARVCGIWCAAAG